MAILKETTVSAKTVQEALEKGKQELGISETEDVQFEVLQYEEKKLFRKVDAVVRVYVEGEEPVKKSEKPSKPAKEEKKAEKRIEKKAEKKPEPAPQENIAEKKAAEDTSPENPLVAVSEDAYSEPVKAAIRLLGDIFKEMDLNELTFSVEQNENEAQINISGENASYLIGRRGETMSALQYLVSLAVNRKKDSYYRIMLNVEHYREKREKTLAALAIRMANNAVRTGRSNTLEPMNPYERRIIHATVQTVEGAVSASIGEEPNRRVVIRSVSGKPDGKRRNFNGNRGHNGGKGRAERPKKREYIAPLDENGQKREPKSDVDFGNLYGKIEL